MGSPGGLSPAGVNAASDTDSPDEYEQYLRSRQTTSLSKTLAAAYVSGQRQARDNAVGRQIIAGRLGHHTFGLIEMCENDK